MNDNFSWDADERKQDEEEEDDEDEDKESYPVLFGFNALYVPAMSKCARLHEERVQKEKALEARRRKELVVGGKS